MHSLSQRQAFNSVRTFEQEKARFPSIRDYCLQILRVNFKGDPAFCPMHGGHTGHSFQINDTTQKWRCWSECRDRCPRHGNGSSIAYQQPCICRGDILDLHMLTFQFESKREAIDSLLSGECGEPLPKRTDKFVVVSSRTVTELPP